MTDHSEPTGIPIETPDEAELEIAPAPTAEELGIDLPGDPEEAQEVLLRALAGALADGAEHRDGYLRALAEADNIRKRSIRDRTTFIEQASERLMQKLLPVLDSFQAGLDVEVAGEAEEKLLSGMRGVFTQLMDALASEGLEAINAEGADFDPNLHEAISILGEGDALVVHHQMRRGFRLKDRVLRPASVVVGPAPEEGDTT